MTFDEFKKDFIALLKNSTVNLGRKTAKTRQVFIQAAIAKFDAFGKQCESNNKKSTPNPMDSSVLRIKPKDNSKALGIGKGVHAMTSSESMRADEQLNRSPYGDRQKKEES